MSNGRDFTAIVEAAREHYHNLKTDIENAKDRIEHIRLTTLAQEAHNLLTELEDLVGASVDSDRVSQTELDLPDFKSPFTPPVQ